MVSGVDCVSAITKVSQPLVGGPWTSCPQENKSDLHLLRFTNGETEAQTGEDRGPTASGVPGGNSRWGPSSSTHRARWVRGLAQSPRFLRGEVERAAHSDGHPHVEELSPDGAERQVAHQHLLPRRGTLVTQAVDGRRRGPSDLRGPVVTCRSRAAAACPTP